MQVVEQTGSSASYSAPSHNGDRMGIQPAKQKVIAVLTPTLGQVSMFWTVGLINLIWPMNMGKGIIPIVDLVGGEVGETRNKCVAAVLDAERTSGQELEGVFWLDDDVIVSKFALLQLVSHDREIAAGVYFTKGDLGEPLIFSGPSSGTLKFRPDETFEAWGWAQGLSYVQTKVYKEMAENLDLGKDRYGNPCWYKKPDPGVSETGQITIGGTEDFHFFANANKLGYRCLVDCGKHAFGWHYDSNTKSAYPKKQWQQFLKREPIVWEGRKGNPEVVWD